MCSEVYLYCWPVVVERPRVSSISGKAITKSATLERRQALGQGGLPHQPAARHLNSAGDPHWRRKCFDIMMSRL
jgi:hypothetical protein